VVYIGKYDNDRYISVESSIEEVLYMMMRQGDIAMREIKELPKGCERENSLVVKMGEATGHAHRLEGDAQILIWKAPQETDRRGRRVGTVIDRRFVKTGPRGAVLKHEEHLTIIIQPNSIFEIVDQIEYDPLNKENRRILD
jgi:hypothetical protein